jgi:pimeloyl-ACP methyl ester carboxylesterase
VLPVIFEDLVPNLMRNPRAIVRVANLARRADLRPELERLRDRGLPITILWGTRDSVIPRESFEALCVASGVDGTVVEGSHSWLIADPRQFGEVITNDVRVAQAARDLERGLDHTKQRGLRREPSLRRRQAAVAPPPEDLRAAE